MVLGLLSLTDFVSEGWSREFNQRLLPPSEWKVAEAVQSLKWSPTFDFSGTKMTSYQTFRFEKFSPKASLPSSSLALCENVMKM